VSSFPEINQIAFIGDYLPRRCGIATFTHDLFQAVSQHYPHVDCLVAPVNDSPAGYDYPPEVRYEIQEQDLDSYRRTADYLNFNNVDLVSLQHEFGIYGGPAGSYILALLRALRMPVVTTLHTVLREPNVDQRRVMKELVALSSRIVVMSERGKTLLAEVFDTPEEKVDVIPHGIPDMAFVDPNFYKDKFGVEGKYVALTFGLLSPGKGIEYVLRAIPEVVKIFPNFVYVVLGATHPNLVRDQGEAYRQSLERLAGELGIRKHVSFYNRFLELKELKEFLGAADIYVTPYLNQAQISSGTLAYALGCGKAVISTPYWHAEELLAEGRGVLVPFADSSSIAREIIALLSDESARHAMRKRAYMAGRSMVWSHVAHLYMDAFHQARQGKPHKSRKELPTLDQQTWALPTIRLDHLRRMTDSTGMLQHARYNIPNFKEGYCTDDNARALILTVLLEETGRHDDEIEALATRYAAFLDLAFDGSDKGFRNFMSFDRKWLERVGSDDSQGRAIWALGMCVGRSRQRSFQFWAAELFSRALPAIVDASSPRAWGFALLGIHEYRQRLAGDRLANQVRDALLARLVTLYEDNVTADWKWIEPILSYDNARIPQALIAAGSGAENTRAVEAGLAALRWLLEIQRSEGGYLRPVGCNGFFEKGAAGPAHFDQQPLEACATVSACLEAYRFTHDTFFLQEARLAFEWFLGRNDLGIPLFDPKTGGCRDALQQDRTNENQGAESTLSFLLALTEMQLLEDSLTVFSQPTDRDRETTSFLRQDINS